MLRRILTSGGTCLLRNNGASVGGYGGIITHDGSEIVLRTSATVNVTVGVRGLSAEGTTGSDGTLAGSATGEEGVDASNIVQGSRADAATPGVGEDEVLSAKEKAKRKAEEFIAKGFTARQAAWISPDPDLARLPRLTRKEAGSYGRPDFVAQYVKELEEGMKLPPGVSMYNLDEAMPEILEPMCPEYDAMQAIKQQHPDMSMVEVAKRVGFHIQDIEPIEDSVPHLRWTFRNVLVPLAAGEQHPVNSKVKCEFHLKSLQEHYSLSDEAVDYIALICDQRYDAKTGIVTLVSDSFASRDENRVKIEQIIRDLVKEGQKVGPKKGAKKSTSTKKKSV